MKNAEFEVMKNTFLDSQLVSDASIEVAVKSLTEFGRLSAQADRISLALTLNILTDKEAIIAIRKSLVELDSSEEYQALYRLAEALKRAVTRSNDGKGTKISFLGDHGGKVTIPLKWQRNPKQCLGLDKEKDITFEIFTAETKTKEEELKKAKEAVKESKLNPDKQIAESIDKIDGIMAAIGKLGKEELTAFLAKIKHEYSDSLMDRAIAVAVNKAGDKEDKKKRIQDKRDHLTQNIK